MKSADAFSTELRFLIGPTAVGKTALSLGLAEAFEAEILSLDSMQVYLGMDIGTAKASQEERQRVPHHLIDLVPANETYDARRYLSDAERALGDLSDRGRGGLFVGGTGFYLKALVHGIFEGPAVDADVRAGFQRRASEEGSAALHAELSKVDPSAAERIHPNDEKRVIRGLEVHAQTGRTLTDWQKEWGWHGAARVRPHRIVGLGLPTARLEERIRERSEAMLEAGWVEEAVAVRSDPGFSSTSIQALGYADILAFADGELSRGELLERLVLRTRQFARRQRTWFRSFDVLWIDEEDPDLRFEAALEHFAGDGSSQAPPG